MATTSAASVRAEQDLYMVVRLPDGRAYYCVLDGRKERYLLGRFDAQSKMPPDLMLDDRTVSRKHCELIKAPTHNQWMVRDLNSANGTEFDGIRVDPERSVMLNHGSRLRLGDTQISVGLGLLPPGAGDVKPVGGGPGSQSPTPPVSPETRMLPPRPTVELTGRIPYSQPAHLTTVIMPMAPAPAPPRQPPKIAHLLLIAGPGTDQPALAGVDQLCLKDGDRLSVAVCNGCFSVEPVRPAAMTLDDMLLRITPENRRPETPWVSPPAGEEG